MPEFESRSVFFCMKAFEIFEFEGYDLLPVINENILRYFSISDKLLRKQSIISAYNICKRLKFDLSGGKKVFDEVQNVVQSIMYVIATDEFLDMRILGLKAFLDNKCFDIYLKDKKNVECLLMMLYDESTEIRSLLITLFSRLSENNVSTALTPLKVMVTQLINQIQFSDSRYILN
ncbi:Serine/threonine-protein kinase TOR [Smittium culicis]|uniref:Serine/threonine-protein kinase TOR n=1 Tax=Smittium culicis TaxID=133412 RepID=A0A1R1XW74_9FUNG|nr:Serine/threonine-protein kinase TOR [Smittium culicis]